MNGILCVCVCVCVCVFAQHCDPEFTKHVVMRLQDKIYSPGDYIIRAGQEGDCMFFIIKVRTS